MLDPSADGFTKSGRGGSFAVRRSSSLSMTAKGDVGTPWL